MGTLGQYLRSAREAREIDLRDAAQMTRISINYLKALEEEDFAKLPGEVFVKGFLKNYGRFLNLNEAEILKKYAELKPQPPAPSSSPSPSAAANQSEKACVIAESASRQETPIEPFVWGSVIFISLLVFLFTSLPAKHPKSAHQTEKQSLPVLSVIAHDHVQAPSSKPEKLYLEVVAVKDTWLLVRTDASPQKKAVLKKGESLIWSADDRFLLSYGRVEDVKLLLNGEELIVKGARETTVRDLAVTRAGVVNQPVEARQPMTARPKPKPAAQPHQARQRPAEVPASPSPVPVSAPAPALTPAPPPPPTTISTPAQAPSPASSQPDTAGPQAPAQ